MSIEHERSFKEAETTTETEHPEGHSYHKVTGDNDPEVVARIRDRHRRKKSGTKPSPKSSGRRIILWSQLLIVLFIIITAGLTIRAIETTTIRTGGISWFDELKRGNFTAAAEKFTTVASTSISQVFSSDLSRERLMKDFNAALPHLKKAGYTLTELEVELGIPPKLIPHFYHNPDVRLDMEQTLAALKDNGIGTALMHALKEAGSLQKELEVSDMKFSHIEVELGPIPSLKLQYKAQEVEGSAVRNARSAR